MPVPYDLGPWQNHLVNFDTTYVHMNRKCSNYGASISFRTILNHEHCDEVKFSTWNYSRAGHPRVPVGLGLLLVLDVIGLSFGLNEGLKMSPTTLFWGSAPHSKVRNNAK